MRFHTLTLNMSNHADIHTIHHNPYNTAFCRYPVIHDNHNCPLSSPESSMILQHLVQGIQMRSCFHNQIPYSTPYPNATCPFLCIYTIGAGCLSPTFRYGQFAFTRASAIIGTTLFPILFTCSHTGYFCQL